jgi:hypothetical protein
MKTKITSLALVLTSALIGAQAAEISHSDGGIANTQDKAAQEQTQDKDGWDFRIGCRSDFGHQRHGRRSQTRSHGDDSFIDVLDILDFTSSLNLEVRKGRFLFFSEGLYLKTSTDGAPRGLFSGGNVAYDQKLAFDDLAVGYAVVKNDCFSLEAFAGAQLVYLEPKLTLSLPIADRTASTSKFWADPIVGVYLNYRFHKVLGFYTKGDVGGFDVSSRLTWQVEGGLDWAICRNLCSPRVSLFEQRLREGTTFL